jgi:hypothetical protein
MTPESDDFGFSNYGLKLRLFLITANQKRAQVKQKLKIRLETGRVVIIINPSVCDLPSVKSDQIPSARRIITKKKLSKAQRFNYHNALRTTNHSHLGMRPWPQAEAADILRASSAFRSRGRKMRLRPSCTWGRPPGVDWRRLPTSEESPPEGRKCW